MPLLTEGHIFKKDAKIVFLPYNFLTNTSMLVKRKKLKIAL